MKTKIEQKKRWEKKTKTYIKKAYKQIVKEQKNIQK